MPHVDTLLDAGDAAKTKGNRMKTYHMYRARGRAFGTPRDGWQKENSDIIGWRLMVKAQDIALEALEAPV